MNSRCSFDCIPRFLFTADKRALKFWTTVCVSMVLVAHPTCGADTQKKPLTKAELEDIEEFMKKADALIQRVESSQEAFKVLKEKAEGGDSVAQCSLGKLYFRGSTEALLATDLKESRKWFEKSADQGNARALAFLGLLYADPRDKKRDVRKAVESYRKSAALGDHWGKCGMGDCSKDGLGVKKDLSEALKWYMESADNGNWFAQYRVGEFYAKGMSGEKKPNEAANWYKKAADQGHPLAQTSLALLYVGDELGPSDYGAAVRLFLPAAAHGDPGAQVLLGMMFQDGLGVPQDFAEAYKYFLVSKAHGGGEMAQKSISDLERKKGVTKETLAEGRIRAKAYGKREFAKYWGDD